MKYKVKQLADLAGVSRRTLHHYDEIGLLKPSAQGKNRYRYYDEQALLRLQQILFYRELGLSLKEIKEILNRPDFDVLDALRSHKTALQGRVQRLQCLLGTVDKTINHLTGEINLSKKEIFEGFSEEQQEEYADEARRLYGRELVDESMKRWKSYSEEKKKRIMAESRAVYREIAENMEREAGSPEVQDLIAQWHRNMRYFYEPTYEILRGLGRMYNDNPDFRVQFEKLHPDLPEFLFQAIQIYCKGK